MNKQITLKQFFWKNSYLLLAAACLVTISFIIDNYLSGTSSTEAVRTSFSKYIASAENDFETIVSDSVTLKKIEDKKYDEAFLQEFTRKKYYFFVYNAVLPGVQELVFWNTQVVTPDSFLLQRPGNTGFVSNQNGYYVWRKYIINNLTAFALVPVKWNYSITNENLVNTFALGVELEKNYLLSENKRDFSVFSKEGTFLFSIEQKPGTAILHNNYWGLTCRLGAALLVLLFIQLLATFLVQKNFYVGVAFLLMGVLLLRVLSYVVPIPLNLSQYELFNPSVYGSSFILRSLGDLLVNSILFLWIVLFIRHYVQEKNIVIPAVSKIARWVIIFTGVGTLIACTFSGADIIRSLVVDSQISFDVVNFFTLNGYSVIGFLVLGCIAISYFFLTQIVIFLLQPLIPQNIWVLILFITIEGLLYLSFLSSSPNVIFQLYLLIWLMIYLLLLNNRFLFFLASAIISSRLIFWLFFYSVSIAFIIIDENKEKEIEKRKQYAEALSLKADPSAERLLNTFLIDFRNEALSPIFENFKIPERNKFLKDSLLNENFSGYLNKYDTKIFTFDDTEKPLFNEDLTSYTTLSSILKTQGKPTAISELFYFDVSYDKFTYISKKSITDSAGNLLGYVFILASPKKYKTDALYPELFLKGYNTAIENSPIYSFAVYNKLKLVSSHNDYAFPLQLGNIQLPKNDFETNSREGYNELWYKAASDRVVIIAKKDNLFIESITMFSYLFCSFLLVTGVFWLFNALIRSKLRWREITNNWQLSIRSQVHGTIIFITLLSFLVVGIATVLFFIDRYQNNNKERLSRTIKVMQNEVRIALGELTVFDDVLKVYDEGYKSKLEKVIARISEVHTVDINLYDLEGTLKVSSLPLPYDRGIVSSKMSPEAYYHMHLLKEIQFFDEENIGTLKYLSNYVPVIDETGKEYAYLSIPYFTSQTKLRQEISNFLVAIINLNAFIFLIAGIVALFITNRITRSFTFISNKMKEVNLGKMNEAIIWKRNDEIGELVKEYNKMVGKLDDSAAALAKSEREGAWREMARQVAHEIKNPLTPMKLSLQYLQKAIDSNTGNVNELSKSVARTLVEQIDHLSQIAGEFSQFANIGNPRNEVFDLNESLFMLTQLHAMEENVEIEWVPIDRSVKVNADKTHINRLFTNLIQNAIQAVPEERKGQIQVGISTFANRILITVHDNGNGIPENMRSKIFMPNFTTKTSGTGLGLAMCKGIVEQSKGSIWFETKEGEGTTFFVELPLVDE